MVLAAAAMVMFLLSRHQSQSPTRKCLPFDNAVSTRSLVKIIELKRILGGCRVPKIDAEVLRQTGTIVAEGVVEGSKEAKVACGRLP